MPEPTRNTPAGAPAKPEADKNAKKDLDIRPDEANKVKGGLRRTGDPCDGGE